MSVLSVTDFATRIRRRYGAYEEVDDTTLVTKFLDKYPVYKDRVDLGAPSTAAPEPTLTPAPTPAAPEETKSTRPQAAAGGPLRGAEPELPSYMPQFGVATTSTTAQPIPPADLLEEMEETPEEAVAGGPQTRYALTRQQRVRGGEMAEPVEVPREQQELATQPSQGERAHFAPTEVRPVGAGLPEGPFEQAVAMGRQFSAGVSQSLAAHTQSRATDLMQPLTGAGPEEELDSGQRALYERGKELAESNRPKRSMSSEERNALEYYQGRQQAKTLSKWAKPRGEWLQQVSDIIAESIPEDDRMTMREAQLWLSPKNPNLKDPRYIDKTAAAFALFAANNAVYTMEATPSLAGPVGMAASFATLADNERGNWQREAREAGIDDQEILAQQGTAYGIFSGLIEQGSQEVILAPLRPLIKGGKGQAVMSIAKSLIGKSGKRAAALAIAQELGKVLGVGVTEMAEELGQSGLSNWITAAAFKRMVEKHPERADEIKKKAAEWAANKPDPIQTAIQAFGTGVLLGGGPRVVARTVQGIQAGTQESAASAQRGAEGATVETLTRQQPTTQQKPTEQKPSGKQPIPGERRATPKIEEPARRTMVQQLTASGLSEQNAQAQYEEMVSGMNEEQRVALNEFFQRMEDKLYTDPLTGLRNRQWGVDQGIMSPKGKWDDEPREVINIDIDNFKKGVNDPYGHPVGDDVLRATGEVLSRNLRRKAEIIRYGGEEIAVLPLTGVDKTDILRGVDAARRELANMEFADGKLKGVTFSAGYGNTFADADAALYEAKKHGRAQTYMGGEPYGTENALRPTPIPESKGVGGSQPAPYEAVAAGKQEEVGAATGQPVQQKPAETGPAAPVEGQQPPGGTEGAPPPTTTPETTEKAASQAKTKRPRPPHEQSGAVNLEVFSKLGGEIRRVAKKWLVSGGHQPNTMLQLDIERIGRLNAPMRQASFAAAEMKQAFKEAYGTKDPSDEVLAEIDAAIKGDVEIETLPEPIRPAARKFRDHVDATTREALRSGVIPEPLVPRVEENIGTYMRRAYQIHNDPQWRKKISPDVRNAAHAYLVRELENVSAGIESRIDNLQGRKTRLEQLLTVPGTDPDKVGWLLNEVNTRLDKAAADLEKSHLTHEQIEGLLNEFLNKHDGIFDSIDKATRLGAKNLSSLKRRTDIPVELRNLMGEYKDPITNYVNTIAHQSQLIANHTFLSQLREAGLREGWLKETPQTDESGDYSFMAAPEGSKVMEPLNGLYTTKDIMEELEGAMQTEQAAGLMRLYMKAVGLAKYAKTVGSVQTHVRNFLANPIIALAAGHWDVVNVWEATKAIYGDLSQTTDTEMQSFITHLIELGVIGDSARAGELRSVFKDAFGNDMESFVDSRLKRLTRAAPRAAAKLYQTEDDFWKIHGFLCEMSLLSEVYSDLSVNELEKMAAKNVRRIYPYYSQVPRLVKAMRRLPFGPFVSFPAEIIRGSASLTKLMATELANPKTRKIGARRLAGMGLAVGIPAAAGVLTRMASKIEPDEEKDIRLLLPPWSRNSQILWFGSPSKGKFKYIDFGYTDPYTYVKTPFIAFLRGEDVDNAALEALGETLSPFISEDIFASKLLDWKRNTTKEGRQIYNPTDDLEWKMIAVVKHFADAIEPGTISSARRIYYGVTGKEVNTYGKKYNPKIEALATAFGLRISEIDVPTALSFKAGELSKNLINIGRIGRERGEEEQRKAYGRVLDNFHFIVRAARRLGVTEEQIALVMKQNRVSGLVLGAFSKDTYKEHKDQIIDGLVARSSSSQKRREVKRTLMQKRLEEARTK